MANTLVYVVLWISFGITVLGFTVPCDQPVVVCPNTTVEFNCSVQSGGLIWIAPADINSNDESEVMLQIIFSKPDPVTMGIYTASLIEGDAFYVSSVLSFISPIDSTNSNKDIVCALGGGDSGPSCSFSIEGIPSSPINPSVIGISRDTVNVSWSTPTNGNSCINHYTVSIISNGTSMYEVANTTHLIIDGLMQGSTYSYTVQAVDYGGRNGDTSESVTLLLDVPGEIQNLTYFVSTVMDPYYSINVNWIESDSTNTLTPPVTHYNIYHNISSSSAITESFDTSVTFHNVSCDTLYLITVNGENVVGEGGNTSISIYKQCTQSPTITTTSADTVTSLPDSTYTNNSNDIFTTASTVSETLFVTSLVNTSSTVSHSTNRSHIHSTTIPSQTSPSNVVIVSVGVVCGILLVMISIFITVTVVVLWRKKKGCFKYNDGDQDKISVDDDAPPLPPYDPTTLDYNTPSNKSVTSRPQQRYEMQYLQHKGSVGDNKEPVVYNMPNISFHCDDIMQDNVAYGVIK